MGFDLETLEALAKAVRAAAAPRTWSRGVVLARERAVDGQEENEDELVLSVKSPDRPIAATVVLYPETEEWDCDCGTRLDVCPHTAAAVIAVTSTAKAGTGALPQTDRARATLRYVFRRQAQLLRLEREEVSPDGEAKRVATPLARAVADRSRELSVREVDFELDRLLPKGTTLIDRRDQAELLFKKLEEAAEVRLEGDPVSVVAKPLLPKGRVLRRRDRWVLRIEGTADAVVAPDIARVGPELRLLGEVGLCGHRLEKLPVEKVYRDDELAVLTQEVLPIFEARFLIEGKDVLPRGRGRGRPRLDFEVGLGERSVTVTASIVYGDPPVVRIEDGRPVYLGGGAAPERDFEAEHRLVARLRDGLNLMAGKPTTVEGAEGAQLLNKVRAFEAAAGVDMDEVPTLEARLEIDDEGRFTIYLEGEGEEGEVQADAQAALRAYSDGHPLVPLSDGGWGRISGAWWAAHADEVALLLQLRDREGRVPAFALPTLGQLAEALDQPPPPGLGRLAPLFRGFRALPESSLPDDLKAELRPYQAEGVRWLSFLKSISLGALLADDMGLGKTLQTICVLEGRSLVVCPTSVLGNWAREIARFRPGLRTYVHHGPRRKMDDEADVVLTTYALLRADRERLAQERWRVCVLDEAQAIKNAESQTARGAFALDADFRVALTGTPVENRLLELWSQMHFINPGLLGGRSDFETRFATPIGNGDDGVAARLRQRTKPFVLRRLKKEVARDLPPRTDMVLGIELDEGERGAYDAVRAATQKELVARLQTEAGGPSVMAALEALLRLRQAACHTGLLPGRSQEGSSKLDVLIDVLEPAVAEGHKALVFSQWTSFLDLTEPQLRKADLPFIRLDGSTRDRDAVVQAFQAKDGPPVMLLSLKAGGTGLNLTAADHVFLLDPWWNPAVEDQAADRAHRIGQDRPVMVHRLVAKDTVEERILELQAKKRTLAEAAVGEGGGPSITKEDLLALLE